MRVKKVLVGFLAALMVVSFAGCGSGGETGTTGSDKSGDNTLTIWAWDEAFNIVAANEAKAIYQEDNPDVNVEVVTMAQDDIVAKLNTSLSSGSYDGLPDIVLIEDYKIQGYLTAYPNEFADLSDIASADDFAQYKT